MFSPSSFVAVVGSEMDNPKIKIRNKHPGSATLGAGVKYEEGFWNLTHTFHKLSSVHTDITKNYLYDKQKFSNI
jgi:hypothetical protein